MLFAEFTNLSSSRSKFQRVGPATEKNLLPIFVILEQNKKEFYDRRISECKYCGCFHESAW